MLSRHFLRAKALQSIYACQVAGIDNTLLAEKNFAYNISRINELGALQLASLREVVAAGRQVIEDGLHKYLPSEEDLHPSYRVVDNMFLTRLFDNYDYRQQSSRYTFPWAENTDVMRKIYTGFRTTKVYQAFITTEEGSFATDQRLALDFFKYIINDESFRDLFNERSLLWEDDFDQVAQYNYALLKGFTEETLNEAAPMATMSDERDERDMEAYNFARKMVINTTQNIKSNEALICKYLNNWEFERVPLMDILLINMAITEFTECPSIPERVTVDEYIELSKEFSTDKSKIFINGILDKLIIVLRSAGRINKSGRGLYIPNLDDEESTEN